MKALSQSPLLEKLPKEAGRLDLLEDLPLLNVKHLGPAPSLFVGDEVFHSCKNLLQLLPRLQLSRKQLVFNYRLSRSRWIVKNAFGILAAQWRKTD